MPIQTSLSALPDWHVDLIRDLMTSYRDQSMERLEVPKAGLTPEQLASYERINAERDDLRQQLRTLENVEFEGVPKKRAKKLFSEFQQRVNRFNNLAKDNNLNIRLDFVPASEAVGVGGVGGGASLRLLKADGTEYGKWNAIPRDKEQWIRALGLTGTPAEIEKKYNDIFETPLLKGGVRKGTKLSHFARKIDDTENAITNLGIGFPSQYMGASQALKKRLSELNNDLRTNYTDFKSRIRLEYPEYTRPLTEEEQRANEETQRSAEANIARYSTELSRTGLRPERRDELVNLIDQEQAKIDRLQSVLPKERIILDTADEKLKKARGQFGDIASESAAERETPEAMDFFRRSMTEGAPAGREAAVERATASPTADVRQYLGPYEEALRAMEERGTRHFREQLLPQLRTKHLGGGTYNTGKRFEDERKLTEDFARDLAGQRAQFMMGATQNAFQHMGEGRRRELAAADLRDKFARGDFEKRGAAAEKRTDLRGKKAREKLYHADIAQQMAERERLLLQQARDMDYATFREREDYPFLAASRVGGLYRDAPNLPMQSIQTGVSTRPIDYGAGASTALGGLAAGGAGMLAEMLNPGMRRKKGGHLNLKRARKKFEIGGHVEIPQEKNFEDDPYIQEFIKERDALKQPGPSPFWRGIQDMGMAIAASGERDGLQALAKAGPHLLKGWREGKAIEEAKKDKIARMNELLHTSRVAQTENMHKRKLELMRYNLDIDKARIEETKAKAKTTESYADRIKTAKTIQQGSSLTSSEQKKIDEAKQIIQWGEHELDILDNLEKIIKGKELNKEGTVIEGGEPLDYGGKGSWIDYGRSKITSKGYPREQSFNKLVNELVVGRHQSLHNIPRAEAFVKRIDATKPELSNSAEANLFIIQMERKEVKKTIAREKETIQSIMSTKEKFKQMAGLDDEFGGEVGSAEQAQTSFGGNFEETAKQASQDYLGPQQEESVERPELPSVHGLKEEARASVSPDSEMQRVESLLKSRGLIK